MGPQLMFLVAWLGGLLFSGAIVLALVTWSIRAWQQIRADGDGGTHTRILDAVERLEVQVGVMNERLERLERRALPPSTSDAAREAADPRPPYEDTLQDPP